MTELTKEQKRRETVRLRVQRWRRLHSDLLSLRQREYNRTFRAKKRQRRAIRKALRIRVTETLQRDKGTKPQ